MSRPHGREDQFDDAVALLLHYAGEHPLPVDRERAQQKQCPDVRDGGRGRCFRPDATAVSTRAASLLSTLERNARRSLASSTTASTFSPASCSRPAAADSTVRSLTFAS